MDSVPGFIAYREQGRHLVAFGGVHAPESSWDTLLDGFFAEAIRRRRRVLVVQLREPQVRLFLARRATVNQLGSSFGLSLRHYSFSGIHKMKLRNKLQRARKAGLRVVEIGCEVPRDETTFAQLRAISVQWLAAKGKKELDFMIGEIGEPGDVMRRIFMVLDSSDRAVGFITYVPVGGGRPGYLHDLTRRLPQAPVGAMELCNSYAMERMIAEGVEFLHLGFTPFIVEGSEFPGASPVMAWLARMLRRYGQCIYPAESQASYKRKWDPDIVEREYIAARPLSLRAVIDLLLLTRSL
jgi:lysylphosphatidylglycerol synthetase-like protein (DUF2156 family)